MLKEREEGQASTPGLVGEVVGPAGYKERVVTYVRRHVLVP